MHYIKSEWLVNLLCQKRSLEKAVSTLEMELAASRKRSQNNNINKNNNNRQKAFVVIGINTGFSSKSRRDSLRQTWMPTGKFISNTC